MRYFLSIFPETLVSMYWGGWIVFWVHGEGLPAQCIDDQSLFLISVTYFISALRVPRKNHVQSLSRALRRWLGSIPASTPIHRCLGGSFFKSIIILLSAFQPPNIINVSQQLLYPLTFSVPVNLWLFSLICCTLEQVQE